MKKRILSMLLALVMLATLLPLGLIDTAEAAVSSGTCGENVNWTLTNDGTLTISGTGAMTDYVFSDGAPWYGFRSQVKTVVIENGVTSIGNSAFYGCSSLTSVTIPNSVTSIGSSAFGGCTALTDVYYGGSKTDWLTLNGHDQIPDSATVHFKDNLYDSGTCGENVNWTLTNDGTLTISGTGTMADYDSLNGAPWDDSLVKTVIIENGVTSIGQNAFRDCSSLTRVTIPNGVTSIGAYAFEDCTSLTSVTIPGSVTSIGERAFYNCSSLTSVTIPDGVTSIDWGAFYGCSSLTSVTIPNSVTSIGDLAFYDCSSLIDVYYDGYGLDWLGVNGHGQIPDSATVHFKENLYDSGTCGENVNWTLTADGTLTISGKGCISDYTAVYDKNTSEFVTDAPWQAAKLYIKAVVIENGVTGIGEHAFYACRVLERVTIPDTVTSIGDYAFCFCQELTGVTIPNSVTSLGSYIFNGCFALTSVTIPNSVTSIGSSAFDGCSSLTDVYYNGYGIDWMAVDGHGEIPDSATVHFKDNLYGKGECGENVNWTLDASGTLTISGTGAMYDYDFIGDRNPAPWCANGLNNRVRTVVVKKGITELGYNAFTECGELKKVTLPSGLKRIGSCAFISCYSLPELTIPATVTTIESNAFTHCDSIKTLTLPGGLKEIGDAACSQMESLSSVTLGKGITRLSPYMFNMCYALTSVTVPEGVTDIGSCAFRYCESLQTLRLPASLKTVGEAASSGTSIADVYFAGTAAQWNALRMDPGNNHIRCAKVHYRNAAAVPAAPKIKLTTSGNQFQLSWNAVSGATSYQVYRIVDSTVEDYTLLGTTKSTTFTDKTAKTGTTYTFAVKAVNANGESMTSSPCAGKLTTTTPDNVTLSSAKAVSGGIKVTWTQTEGAVKYNVYRRTADTKWTSAPLATVSGTSFTDKTVKAGETYIYTVRGVSSDGKTLSAGYDKTGVTATALPATVTLGTAKAGANGIKVTWKQAEGAIKYRVYRQTAGESSWTTLTSSATGTSFTDKKATAGVTYTYTVRGMNSANGLSAAYDKTGVTATALPATVTLGTAKAGANGIKVTWAKTEGAVKYNVYRRTADTKWTSTPLATVSGTSFTDKTVKAGETYIYTVRGIASDGKSLSTGYDKTGVTATALPATVKLTGAKASGSSIVVTWSKAEGAVRYRVYRQAAGESSWTTLTSSATGTSYTDKKAKAGVTYTYTVRALNSANGLSAGYDKNGVKAIIAPATVTLGTARAGANGITVTWAKAEGAVKYNVYRRTADTKWTSTPLATVSGTSFTDKTAKAGAKYIYTVRGVASDGKTLSTGYDKTGVTATALPATVKLTGAKVSGSSIVVTWSKAEGAVKYRVYRKSAGTDWTTLTSSATGTSYTDKTVKAGVKYTYTVRALNSVNRLSGGYDKNGVSAVIEPAKVVLVSARADSAGILVTWKAASGAHTYQVYRKTASDGWKLVAKNISDTEWKDTSAVKGTTYTYTVRAVADDGTTRGACDTRGKSAAVTKASTTPANVTMGTAKAGKKGITVTWSYAAEAKTYNVYRQVAGEKTWTAVAKNVNGKSWTDTKVTKGTKYTYMVRGVSANGKALSRDCTATVSATAK